MANNRLNVARADTGVTVAGKMIPVITSKNAANRSWKTSIAASSAAGIEGVEHVLSEMKTNTGAKALSRTMKPRLLPSAGVPPPSAFTKPYRLLRFLCFSRTFPQRC